VQGTSQKLIHNLALPAWVRNIVGELLGDRPQAALATARLNSLCDVFG